MSQLTAGRQLQGVTMGGHSHMVCRECLEAWATRAFKRDDNQRGATMAGETAWIALERQPQPAGRIDPAP